MADKRPVPVARCTKCGHLSYNAVMINRRCGQLVGDKRCDGVNGSTLNATDWARCQKCAGYGWLSGNRCQECGGVGWIFARF